jgi:uncharacterized protein YgbK (DUF1537 family)
VTPRPSIFAVADDLTGAAEIAAVGYRHGLKALVTTGALRPGAPADLVVADTDSRLAAPEPAAEAVRRAVLSLSGRAGALFYKKVDSVLRGPVLAELEALAEALGRPRALLVPANPSLSRTIRDGRYLVGGVPLHETAFAHDPHHPARSPRVLDLLGPPRRLPVHLLAPGTALPSAGVIVGEASSPDDVVRWARAVDAVTLPAGGAEFFSAWLGTLGYPSNAPTAALELQSPLLVISGTTVPESRAMFARLLRAGLPVIPLNELIIRPFPRDAVAARRWAEEVAMALATRGVAITHAPSWPMTVPDAVAAIRGALADLATRLQRHDAFTHLVIEGGATAAAIVRALGWDELAVVAEWAPGVATLSPTRAPRCRLTLKPGSYPWPDGWGERLAALTKRPTANLGRRPTP